MCKSHLDMYSRTILNQHTANHVFVCNPNDNTMLEFTNYCISRVNVGVRSRERQWGISAVSI